MTSFKRLKLENSSGSVMYQDIKAWPKPSFRAHCQAVAKKAGQERNGLTIFLSGLQCQWLMQREPLKTVTIGDLLFGHHRHLNSPPDGGYEKGKARQGNKGRMLS